MKVKNGFPEDGAAVVKILERSDFHFRTAFIPPFVLGLKISVTAENKRKIIQKE